MTRARLENARVPVRAIGNGVLVELPPARPAGLVPVAQLDLQGPVQACRDHFVLRGHRNRLEPALAALAGCCLAQAR